MFSRKTKQPQAEQKLLNPIDIEIPNGTAIEVKGLFFYVMSGKKHRVISERILQSQNYPRVLTVTPACANRIPNASTKIGFREGQVIKDISDNILYLISDNKRRRVATPDFIKLYGIEDKDILVVSHVEALLHREGENINGL